MNLIKEFDNKLLHRKEVVISLNSEKTPSKVDVSKELAKNFKSSEENIIVEKIESKFGKKEFTVYAKVYHDLASKNKYETVTRKEKKKRAEEAKKLEDDAKKAVEEKQKQEEAVE
jgi:ribosomal protein S24E